MGTEAYRELHQYFQDLYEGIIDNELDYFDILAIGKKCND